MAVAVAEPTAQEASLTAMRLMGTGRLRDALEVLDAALRRFPADVSLWLNLAVAHRASGDLPAAMLALDGALRADPRSFLALLMRAHILETQGHKRQAAQAYGVALTQYSPTGHYDEPTRRAIARAQHLHAEYMSELEGSLRGSVAALGSPRGSAETRRIDRMIDHLMGRRKVYTQQPTHFHLPGLPSIEFFEREEFPWLARLEGATRDIQRELAGMLDNPEPSSAVPYIQYPDWAPLDQWKPLNNSPRWSAIHLLEKGIPVPANADRCPVTMSVLADMPQPRVPNRSPVAMFSLLKPRTRIPPHHGVANTRLVVHLPLVVPPGCGFRVGSETREWKVGQAWIFDDTIEHEAWNDSDELRVVLIFDIWHPHLSAVEREAYARIMASMDAVTGEVANSGI
ncbi:hypothetical protein CHU95_19810 [Niveispirillum lacus]|uniref:Aspartyl/asparaginy/proline hydroxylase domain-containing protein n=1 Tax=Niveispirillum lacus TaxID=1981099 RepID=A0A255YQ95_9PROT|nr:aspartyl/asparaginyl beta-hydroxylase domain-containing protein [Niveispirillum lacus]OYQ31403.1 hypothetical protein CHU95_19810 [Niveispirillum lacus]